MTRYDDAWWQRNADSIAYSTRHNLLTFKERSHIAEYLIAKCKPEVGVFPLSESLISLVTQVHSACPLSFIMREQQRKFLFDLHVYAFLFFLEFVIKYGVKPIDTLLDKNLHDIASPAKQEPIQRYTYNAHLERDFPHIVNPSLPKPTVDIVDVTHGKETFYFRVQQPIQKFLAERVLLANQPTVFSKIQFQRTILNFVIQKHQSFSIDHIERGVRRRIIVAKDGSATLGPVLSTQTKKRTANEAFKD